MARPTYGEKVDELQKFAAGVEKSIEGILRTLGDQKGEYARTAAGLNDLHRQVAVDLAVLRAEVAAVKDNQARADAAREKAAGRAWAVVPNVVGAVVNGSIAAAVAYLVARR